GQLAGGELVGGDVDAGPEVVRGRLLVLPAAQLCASRADDPCADRDDRARGLGKADEAIGREQSARRMLPAQQRLNAGDRAAPELDQRLVVEEELFARERPAELARQ